MFVVLLYFFSNCRSTFSQSRQCFQKMKKQGWRTESKMPVFTGFDPSIDSYLVWLVYLLTNWSLRLHCSLQPHFWIHQRFTSSIPFFVSFSYILCLLTTITINHCCSLASLPSVDACRQHILLCHPILHPFLSLRFPHPSISQGVKWLRWWHAPELYVQAIRGSAVYLHF